MEIATAQTTASQVGFAATYDAILLPGHYADGVVPVDLEVNGPTYTWNMEATDFEPGNEYIYEVTITRTTIQVKGTITAWNPVKKDGVIAE